MITKNIKTKIEEYFLLNPTSRLRARQVERELKVPFPSVVRYLKELQQENILQKTIIADVTLFSANRNSSEYLFKKKAFNLLHLKESKLITHLIQTLSNPTIILFGSYARGEDIESSDIDLYIETESKIKLNFTKFEKKLQRRIQIIRYKRIKQVSNKDLANNIVNGVPLNGFLEVFK